jgi:uncharacterized protein with von Willebrand factor type A (vWA) domain
MDSYDGRLFGELRDASGKLKEMLDAEGAPKTLEPLSRDLFGAFYKAQPDLVPEGEVEDAALRANRPFLEALLEEPKTYETRATTRLDELYSAAAATAATERYLEELEDDPELKAALLPPDEPPEDEQEEEDESEGEPAAKPGPQAPPNNPAVARKLRRAAKAAAEAGVEEAEEVADALGLWGLGPADLKRLPLGERLALARRLSAPGGARRVADLLGRMRNVARVTAKEKVRSRRDEVHSVTLGAPEHPARILPSELASLASPNRLRRLDFLRRLVEGRVLHYDLERDEKRGRGPLVALIDSSWSMNGARMEWAAAVVLALVQAASGPGSGGARPAALVFFNERVVRELRFAPGERSAQKMLDAATVGADGGTEYVAPLARGVEIVGEERDYRDADLLLVTDGECEVPEPFLETFSAEKERLGFRLHSVLVGRRAALGELARYSDAVWALPEDLRSEKAREDAAAIFERLL